MLSSVDGKISTGDTDKRDVDKDFPKIKGAKEGLHQYCALEQQTDFHSLNTGKVMAKIGMNNPKKQIKKLPVSLIIIDNKHLTGAGIENLIKTCKKLYLVTTNKKHPAFNFIKRLELIFYPKEIDFKDLFRRLKQQHKINTITIQSGGTLNAVLVRQKLIDRISLVIAPVLVGGKNTPTLVDGDSLRSETDLKKIRALKLIKCKKLKNSYLHLVYDVMNQSTSN